MGIEFLSFLSRRKKSNSGQMLPTVEPEKVPEYEEGFQGEDNKVVRLVSNKKIKKPYKVTGIEDVASKNNWKAWVYLGPVVVLISIFLLYPLVNTIFISFAKDYQYATGRFSGFTFENFGVIFGWVKTGQGGLETYFTKYAIPNTMIITFVTVPCSILLALIISVALNSIKWFQKFLQTVEK